MNGREADLEYLDNRIRNAKTISEGNLARHKAQEIHKQLADKKLQELRGHLIRAERANDSDRANQVRRDIMAYTNRS